jgi:ubiquinone/menaquinone biosynthesis C-methylase UbiE
MSNSAQEYIHGTSEKEQQRLALLSRITNGSFIRFLGDLSGMHVCDFGCGTGTLTADIAATYPDAHITGLEVSSEQLRRAAETTRGKKNVTLIWTDALTNGCADSTFDLTYCRYLLEHVADPIAAAAQMLRITKPGGLVACQENDLHNVLYWPPIEGHDYLMRQFCRLQMELSGDPFIGRKLFDIFRRAGASNITFTFEPEIYTEDRPDGYRAWLQNARDILVGARDSLIERDMMRESEIDITLAEMARRIEHPSGVALFYWNRVSATKPLESL